MTPMAALRGGKKGTWSADRLPTYLLYADPAGLPARDVVHWESIASRSRLHDWEIQPHRHESLMQVLLVERGRAQVLLDGQHRELRGPALITVMPLAAHGFRFSHDVVGSVLTLQALHVQQLLQREPALCEAVLRTRCGELDATARRDVAQAVTVLREEYGHAAPWRATAIDAALTRLWVAVSRALPAAEPPSERAGSRALAHVKRLRALVEERFRSHPSVVSLAQALAITPTQLNRVCREVLGHSALDVVHARLVLEAQRELTYTQLTVKQVAFDLGFADAGYFTRFFERQVGCSPTQWRRETERAVRGVAGTDEVQDASR